MNRLADTKEFMDALLEALPSLSTVYLTAAEIEYLNDSDMVGSYSFADQAKEKSLPFEFRRVDGGLETVDMMLVAVNIQKK
jgi:hypothetical protein